MVERAAGARELRLVASVGVSDGCGGEVLRATGGNDGGDSFNKLVVFPVKVEARLLFPFFSSHRGGGWRKKERRRAGLCSLGRSSSSMGLRRGNGARFGCRQPVLTVSPLNMLAEGRPFLFLPAWCLDGRQFISESESKASSSAVLCYGRSSCGGPDVPSANVPGDDGIGSGWEMIWTRLHFLFPVRGPPCKKQGLVCNFLSFVCPVVNYGVLVLPIYG